MLNKEKTIVEYSIDAESYEKIVNNIRYMAPLEIGVEVAVYMLMYGVIDHKKYCILDTNTMTKRNAVVFANEHGKNKVENEFSNGVKKKNEVDKTADFAIVGKDFEYNDGVVNKNNKSGAYGLIEVKYFSIKNSDKEYTVQRDYTNHFVWTNGLQWKYCNHKNETVEFDLIKTKRVIGPYKIQKDEFNRLITFLGDINWEA